MPKILEANGNLNDAIIDQEHGMLEKIKSRLTSLAAIGAAALALTGSVVEGSPANADIAAQFTVGMPFNGKWAYPVNVNPPYSDEDSSHPSVHHNPAGGDWSTDLYTSAGQEVKLIVGGDDLNFAWGSASGSCGESRRIKVFSSEDHIGTIYVTHLDDAVSTDKAPTNGMTIGKVANLSCNPGGSAGKHIHMEFRNQKDYSCFYDYGNPGKSLNQGSNLGVIGSSNNGPKQSCGGETAPAGGNNTNNLDFITHPAAVTRGDGMDVFYKDVSGNLVNTGWWPGDGWDNPQVLTGNVQGNPDVATRGVNDMEVAFVDNAGNLRTMGWNNIKGWGEAIIRASDVVGDPTIISRSGGSMDLFWRTDGGSLMNRGWDTTKGWLSAQELATGIDSNPTAVQRGVNTMDVFFRDGYSLMNVGWDVSKGWGAQNSIGPSIATGDPVVIARTSRDMDVFYRTTANNLANIGWSVGSGWRPLSIRSRGDVLSDPTAAARGWGAMEVAFRSQNNDLKSVGWDANKGWSTSQVRGHDIYGEPDIISRGVRSMEIFYKGHGCLEDAGWNAGRNWQVTQVANSNTIG